MSEELGAQDWGGGGHQHSRGSRERRSTVSSQPRESHFVIVILFICTKESHSPGLLQPSAKS